MFFRRIAASSNKLFEYRRKTLARFPRLNSTELDSKKLLSGEIMDISKLKLGDNHYMAYVGSPNQYDFMGATQFRLLCILGLREKHQILDVGCGSLCTGRLFISYLDRDRYFGIEPNKWLIEDAINNQVGKDLVSIKKLQFDYDSDFKGLQQVTI